MRELVRSRVGWVLLALLIVLEVLVGFANVSPGTLLAVTAVNLLVALVVAYHLMSVFRERDRFEEELAHLQEDSSFRPSPARFDLLSASVVRLNRMLEDQHHRQEPLREERDRYRAILDDFAEGVLLVDPEDRILYGNETARDFLDLPGSTRDRTLPELTRSGEIVRAVADARDTDEPVEREITRVEPDRETVLRLHAFRARDNVALVVRDVTRLHRLQTVRKDFVANVSHELKTPLAALRGLVETLRGDGEMDPSTRAGFLDRVRSQIESMTRMVEDLLTLSRLEGEKDETEEFVDVRGPAGDAIDSIRPRARDKNVNLQVEMPDEPLELPTSGTAIRQLVSNLVDTPSSIPRRAGRSGLPSPRRTGPSASRWRTRVSASNRGTRSESLNDSTGSTRPEAGTSREASAPDWDWRSSNTSYARWGGAST